MSDKPEPKVKPEDLPDYSDVFAAPSTGKIINTDPRLHYEWINEDRVNDYLQPKAINDGADAVKGWAVVFEADAKHEYGPRYLRRFADDTVGRDTVVRRRDQVLMCIPREEHKKLVKDHDRLADAAEASLKRGQSESREDGQIQMEDGLEDPKSLLNRFNRNE